MAIFLARYLQKKYKAHKAAAAGEVEYPLGPTLSSAQQNDSHGIALVSTRSTGNASARQIGVPQAQVAKKTDWKWRLSLCLALFIPIFLETLDYTG